MMRAAQAPWWQSRRDALLACLGPRDCAYVYDLARVRGQIDALRTLRAVRRLLYALKANPHPDILRTVFEAGCGFECVSRAEIERVIESVPGVRTTDILFTPNFAPRDEYGWALERGITVTVDNPAILRDWTHLFADHDIFLRLDATAGRGHHEKVRTGGRHSKFGVPPEDWPGLPGIAAAARARVIGLHVHGGSGHFDPAGWAEPARILAREAARYPSVRTLNLGGGLGVPDRPGAPAVDLAALGDALSQVTTAIALWLEPGRFIVADAGVLLARVTQCKAKGETRYVGVATGMNSLIRPALYDAHHEIVNLSRLGEDPVGLWTVVGPICESGDELGRDCPLPRCEEGDVLLIAGAGAYGHAMSSHYNLRAPAPEIVLPA